MDVCPKIEVNPMSRVCAETSKSDGQRHEQATSVTIRLRQRSLIICCNRLFKMKIHYVDHMCIYSRSHNSRLQTHGLLSRALRASSKLYVDFSMCVCVCLSGIIWGLCCQNQVSQAGMSNYIPPFTVGCNYLSLPEIPASGNKVHICNDSFSDV